MTNKRVCEILKNKDIKEIYYNDQPVWIQEVHGNKATVGFVGSNDTKDLYVKNCMKQIKNIRSKRGVPIGRIYFK